MNYNANDRKSIREAKRMARLDELARKATVASLMDKNLGRQYIYNLLSRCHIFASCFNTNGLSMAYNEGERNIGLILTADIHSICPEQYITMIREANDRHLAADARANASGSADPDGLHTEDPIDSDDANVERG